MTTVAFPSGFNLERSSSFRHSPTDEVDFMSDGSPRSRTVTSRSWVTIACQFQYLSATDKTTLESFILANSANTITWTIDGVDYSGRIVGGHTKSMTGPLFNIAFNYYAESV